jgi:hypothetical protein
MTMAEQVPPKEDVIIKRHYDALFLNQVINHPRVRPWVSSSGVEPLDFTLFVENTNNILLMGEYGGVFFHLLQPGLYEAHTQVLPEGRGRWTIAMVQKALSYIFIQTDAVEILTRVPAGNTPALALTKRIGGVFQFTRPNSWMHNGIACPSDIYALSIMNWMRDAEELPLRGRWVDNKIKKELRKQKVEFIPVKDENHDRYVGASIEMIFAGQVGKGIALYNRWASVAGYSSARVVSDNPLAIDFRGVMMIFRGTDFWVIPCR